MAHFLQVLNKIYIHVNLSQVEISSYIILCGG